MTLATGSNSGYPDALPVWNGGSDYFDIPILVIMFLPIQAHFDTLDPDEEVNVSTKVALFNMRH